MDGQKHAVRLWEVNDDMTLKSSIRLDITHTAPIRAILPTGPCRTKLLSGGEDRTIHAYDLGGERKFTTIDCSNKVHHLHETLERDSILVEVISLVHLLSARSFCLIPPNLHSCIIVTRNLRSATYVPTHPKPSRMHVLDMKQLVGERMLLLLKVILRIIHSLLGTNVASFVCGT